MAGPVTIVVVLLIAILAADAYPAVLGVAQVLTAALATLLAWRAISQESARVQVVAVDVRELSEGYGGGLAILRVSIFNPASRGNVLRSANFYRGNRTRKIERIDTTVEQRAVGATGTVKSQTIVLLGGEKVDVNLGLEEVSFPLGLEPYQTKVVDVVCWTGRLADDEVRQERIHMPHRETFLVDVRDGRGRRSSGHSERYDDDASLWRRSVRALGNAYEQVMDRLG
jgi:hypothetical protein